MDHPNRNFLDFRNHAEPFLDHPKPMPEGFCPPPRHEKMPFEFNPGPPTQYGHTALVYLIGVVSSLLFAITADYKILGKRK